jgi:hypothetical protein
MTVLGSQIKYKIGLYCMDFFCIEKIVIIMIT